MKPKYSVPRRNKTIHFYQTVVYFGKSSEKHFSFSIQFFTLRNFQTLLGIEYILSDFFLFHLVFSSHTFSLGYYKITPVSSIQNMIRSTPMFLVLYSIYIILSFSFSFFLKNIKSFYSDMALSRPIYICKLICFYAFAHLCFGNLFVQLARY